MNKIKQSTPKSRLACLAGFIIFVTACSAVVKPVYNPDETGNVFLPPTPASHPPQLPTQLPTPPSPLIETNPTQPFDSFCTDSLTFIKDNSIPDGSEVKPGEKLDKRWEVENSGTCNWDQRYRIRLIGGPHLGAPGEQALFPARGGSRAELRMIFTAPNEADRYRSAWQAYNPQGEPFGDPFFIEIDVVLLETPAP